MFALFHIAGIFGLFFALIGIVLAVAYAVFWIAMFIHALTNKGLSDVEKVMWVVVLLFLHVIGPLLYFFIARPKAPGASGAI